MTQNLARLECDVGVLGALIPQIEALFEQVWVINLRRRPDRLVNFWQQIERASWPFKRPQVFNAIEGDKVGVPKYWQTGGGSFGCLRSHMALLERAIQDDVQSILILEDDAVFQDNFGSEVGGFLRRIPADWQCLMLGGQHVNSIPFPVSDGIVRAGAGGGIQRTHCYALRGAEIMKALYATWANSAVHCDWVMGPCTARFKTYAPDPFLVGQAEGQSDISGRQNPTKFWRSASGFEPVVVLHAPRPVMEALRPRGFHAGFTRDPETGIDCGLRDIFNQTESGSKNRRQRLAGWLDMIQGEVASMLVPAACVVWHPDADAEAIRCLVKGNVFDIVAATLDEALQQLPDDLHKQGPAHGPKNKNIRVVLLDAPRVVMEILRDEGWHAGHWRDEVTGYDNGLRRLFSSPKDAGRISEGLMDLVRTLHSELVPGGIVTLWHESLTPEMLAGQDMQVLHIVADSAHEAKGKLKQMLHEQN